MFHRINKDLSTLNDHVNRCQEQEKTLVMEVQKDHDQQWKLVHCLEALEQREQDREIRIALQEDQIQMLQREVDELQGKICHCHERPGVTKGPVLTETIKLTDGTENSLEYKDDEVYLTPPTNPQTMLSMDVYHFSPPSSYTTLQPIVQSESEEARSEVQSCCHTRVVAYADDIINIADDKRSSSSESSSSDDDVPELESLSDQENVQPIHVPAPLENPPPYPVSGQCAIRSQGIPKSSFHPYPCICQPLVRLFEYTKAEARGFGGGHPSWRTTPTSPSYSPGGYRVGDSQTTSEGERRPLGRGGSFSLSPSGRGDLHSAREEESESSIDASSRNRERNLR